MKHKVLIFCIAILIFLSGGVVASTINGSYNGFPIVNVIVDGVEYNGSTPAININGTTMVPVRFVSEMLGATVQWDDKTWTANITSKYSPDKVAMVFDTLAKEYGANGVSFEYFPNQTVLHVFMPQTNNVESDFYNLLQLTSMVALTPADIVQVSYHDGINLLSQYQVTKSDATDYLDQKIGVDAYINKWEVVNYIEQPDPEYYIGSYPAISSDVPELYSNDGKTFLGKLTTNKFDPESIFNEFGDYGSKFSSTSIWNEFSSYGSKFSSQSAFNEFALEPPIIVYNNQVIGYLTINSFIKGAISPYGLYNWLLDNGW